MQFIVKLVMANLIIILCSQIGRRFPTLGGLIATMPLTGVIVLAWLYADAPGNFVLLRGYTKGALWGIAPSILFFLIAYLGFQKAMPLGLVLCLSFGGWLVGAFLHQWLLR